jgi:type II secretory pathway pseudopilin PulG
MVVVIVLSAFAFIALYYMTNEARLTEHKIKRMRVFYAQQEALLYANQLIITEIKNDPNKQPAAVKQDVETELTNNPFTVNGIDVDISILLSTDDGCNPPAGSDYCLSAVVEY